METTGNGRKRRRFGGDDVRNRILTFGGMLLSIALGACGGSPVAPTRAMNPTASGPIASASAVLGVAGQVRVLDAGEAEGDNENVEPTEPKEPNEKVEPAEPKEPNGDQNQEGNNEGSGQNPPNGTITIKVAKP